MGLKRRQMKGGMGWDGREKSGRKEGKRGVEKKGKVGEDRMKRRGKEGWERSEERGEMECERRGNRDGKKG